MHLGDTKFIASNEAGFDKSWLFSFMSVMLIKPSFAVGVGVGVVAIGWGVLSIMGTSVMGASAIAPSSRGVSAIGEWGASSVPDSSVNVRSFLHWRMTSNCSSELACSLSASSCSRSSSGTGVKHF